MAPARTDTQRLAVVRRQAAHSRALAVVLPIVHQTLRSMGQPLDAELRTMMEPRFGHDFSHVRVHTDAKAAESAAAVGALAYTVGRDVVFGTGQFASHSREGQKLIAHELTHVVQQGANSAVGSDPLPVGAPGDTAEGEADAAAERVAAGARLASPLGSHGLAIRRQTASGDPVKNASEKTDASKPLVEGVKTVAEQAKDGNPKVKKVIIDPLKDRLKAQWNRLSAGEKAGTVGFGAATVGMAGGALLFDPSGRKLLEGVNLATPFTLIPYMPLSSFKYTLPTGTAPDKRLFKFDTTFNADDLINLHTKGRDLPKMSLSVDMRWGYDPATDRLSILGGDAKFGLVPGLSISAGAYKDVLRPPPTVMGPEGQFTQIKKSVPEFGKPQPIPDVRIMLNVDLLRFKPGDLVKQVQNLF